MRGEFSLIERFLSLFPRARVPVGPGDDCAVLAPTRGALCVTTDAVVEDVHFTRAAFSSEDIGHKALAVNLSDLAAMGATPRWFVCALALPRDFPERELRGLARGMSALAREHRIALVGGNFSSARELSITITAAGELQRPRGDSLGRTARPPPLYVRSAGRGAARVDRTSQAGKRRSPAILRQRRPIPRVALGRLAARFASAGMDISDGLAQDLGHLCEASRVGAEVELAHLPLSPRSPCGPGRGAGPGGRRGLRAAARRSPERAPGLRAGVRCVRGSASRALDGSPEGAAGRCETLTARLVTPSAGLRPFHARTAGRLTLPEWQG